MCWLAGTPVLCRTFAPALGRECRRGTQHASATPGSGAEAIPTVVTGGSPGDHTESKEETRKNRSAVTRMYLQENAETPSADVIQAVLP